MRKCSKPGANVREKNGKLQKCHPKMNLCRKFDPNGTMGKCSKLGGNVWWEGEFRGGGDF